MTKPSLAEIDRALQVAKTRYPIGSFWQHYKSGDVYEIVGITADEAIGQTLISYKPVRDNDNMILNYADGRAIDYETGEPVYSHLVFSRPMVEWEETIKVETGGVPVTIKRFVQVYRYHGYRVENRMEKNRGY